MKRMANGLIKGLKELVQMEQKVKVLFLDIETKPILAWVWGLFDQNIGLEQIEDDWRIISFAAKWEGSKEVIQYDIRAGINDKNEKAMLRKLWDLMDKADVIIGQNSKRFDVKKINEQFLKYGMGSPSPFRQEDTMIMSKKYFSPTSHKLEYRSKQLNKKYKKMSHSKFPGFSLWKECVHGNKDAWKEMAIYNVFDVLATEEYYSILKPWANTINYNVYNDSSSIRCHCGSMKLQKRGYNYSNTGKFQRLQCTDCGAWHSSKTNLLSKDKRKLLLK